MHLFSFRGGCFGAARGAYPESWLSNGMVRQILGDFGMAFGTCFVPGTSLYIKINWGGSLHDGKAT